MTGYSFEMEDPRNWSDASFKTYVRPLAEPWPYTMPKGQSFTQKVSLNFSGKTELGTVIPSPILARLIYENRPYASYAAFKKKVGDAALQSTLGDVAALLDAIANDQRIVLRDVEEA